MFTKKLLPLMILPVALGACGGDDDPKTTTDEPRQCGTAEYIAFDAANHTAQDLRIGAFAQMTTLMAESYAGTFDAATATAKFTAAEALYQDTAELRAKVQGRKDDHFAEQPAIGVELDATIMAGLEQGKTATTALAAKIAKQTVEKTLVHFFFLSVYHELVQGQAAKWDEAYGYWGAPSDNAEAGRKGFASVATKRDADNGTNLAAQIFNGIVDGSCELAKALEAADAETIDWKAVPAVKAIVDDVDLRMQEVLAYSSGHEAVDMLELQSSLSDPKSVEDMWVKLAELDPYFRPIEALMTAKGGESAARAARIRARIDAAWADPSGAWMSTFEAQAIIDELEAEYGIDIKA
ncbi:hypothetical protein L6R52_08610 [Myxococcota bacterium]|nr:hypothetical protein [Myxococcota bacterium]